MRDACYRYSPTIPGLLPWQSYGLAFVVGIFGVRFPIPALAALVVLWFADLSLRDRACRLPVFVFICCAAFGFGYASQRTPDIPAGIPAWVEARQQVTVRGVVDRVEPRSADRLRIVLRDVRCMTDAGEEMLPGRVAWNVRHPKYRPAPGQTVRTVMRVVPVHSFGNPGMWDYGWYWQRQGVFWRAWSLSENGPEWGERPRSSLWDMKSGLRRAVAELLPDTRGGAMVLALVTGDKSRLDVETLEATRSAGLAHTLALSGLHVGFVAAIGFAVAYLAGWLYPPLLLSVPRPRLAVIMGAPLVLIYAWLGQPSASLIRAAVMFGFWGFLIIQGRGRVLLDGLFFALLSIVFVSPLSVFDLSLQMSVTAVAGIGLMYPYFRSLLVSGGTWYRRLLGWAGGLLAVSLCANIALMPLVSWYFGTMSPNILLNLIWLPVLGFVVMPLGLLGMAFSVAGWTAPLAGLLLGWAAQSADWLLVLLSEVVGSGMTPVFAVLRPLWPEMFGCGLLLVILVAVWRNRREVPVALVAVGFLFLVAPHVWIMAEDSRDTVRLSMLDVGLGQALVVAAPGGRRWIVDGGGGSKHFDLGEAVVAPSLTRGRPPRLDGVFLTHPDVDHSHGLPFVLSRLETGPLYTNGMMPRGRTGTRLKAVMAQKKIEPIVLLSGQVVRIDARTVLEVLHPPVGFTSSRGNERSLVLRLVRDGVPLALLTGDIEGRGIASMLGSGTDVRSDVLVLPHHGSRSSLSPELYGAVAPKLALASNGYLNRYGFPSPEVVDALNVSFLTTGRNGRVDIRWDCDGAMTVRTFFP